MNSLWPWFAVAVLGALHGLSPANGWLFAAARGMQTGDRKQARRALLPIGVGHLASVALVALAFVQGLSMDPAHARRAAGALLVGMAMWRVLWPVQPHRHGLARRGDVGLALWSFLMATAHGAGMMLVPALVPLCLADNPAREITASGSLLLAVAAVGVHTAAMLLATGTVASGVCRGAVHVPQLARRGRAWNVALAATGVFLLASG